MTAFCGMIDQSIVILNFSSDLLLKVQNSSKDQPMPTSAARERKSVLDGVAYTTARKAAVEDVKAIEAEWLKQVLDVNGPSDAKHLRKTVRPLLKAMGKYSPAAIDLRGLKPESVNGRHLAVIL
ncbi:hypothetical protein [Herbaspirillum huttiense]|uniref:hypothetical protein n=1 Tax=Herbaspirillum huttiense TaxID=863372 RepID=UPI003B3AFE14